MTEAADGPAGGSVSPPALEVVIVSYRCERLLRDCLHSLREHGPAERSMLVHVVDNASGDRTPELVRREFPEVKLTELTLNSGFSVANNVALRASRASFQLILNPDTRILPGALDRMLDLIEEHPEVGMAGPRLELENGSFDHASRRAFPTPLSALGHFSGLGRRRRSGRLAAYRAPEIVEGPVDAVNGAFMLCRREALEQVGLFDEGYWMYMEDLDLCFRFWRAGWKVWFEPTVTVVHVKAGTSGQNRSLKLNRAFHYGMFRFYRAHYASERNPFLNGLIYVGIAIKLATAVVASGARRIRDRLR